MAETHIAPTKHTRTDVQIGLVVTDQRTGENRRIIYADSHVVLTRDATGSTTLTPRTAFETELGSRYRARPTADPDIDGGQYDRLRQTLAEYDGRDGRKASHKADALREAVDLLAGTVDPETGSDDDADASEDGTDADETAEGEQEVSFEDVPGVGPETAGALRRQGFVTTADVRGASDDVLLSVSGVGPGTLENIREHVE